MEVKCAQNLSHESACDHHKLWNKDACRLSACSGTQRVRRGVSALCHRRHRCTCYACCPACCTRRSSFSCDAVVHRTLVLIAKNRSHCFHVAISVAIFLYWRYSVYKMIFWLVFELRSISSSFLAPHQYTCLKNVRTLEHLMFGDNKFTYRPDSEFVPLTVSKLVILHYVSKSFPILDHRNTDNQV